MRAGRVGGRWEGHLLLVSESERERRAAFSAWAARGLDQGEKVICAELATGREALLDVLQHGGVDARLAVADGRLEVVPAARFTVSGVPELDVEKALDEGYPGVRLAPHSLGGRRDAESERVLAKLCSTRPVSALCGIERGAARGVRLVDLVAAHPDGVRSSMLVGRRTSTGLAMAGEVDISNLDLLAAVVGQAAATTAEPLVVLDLSDLRFMDVAGCRALVHATRDLRAEGRALVVANPLPPVAHVLALLKVGTLEGIEIVTQ